MSLAFAFKVMSSAFVGFAFWVMPSAFAKMFKVFFAFKVIAGSLRT